MKKVTFEQALRYCHNPLMLRILLSVIMVRVAENCYIISMRRSIFATLYKLQVNKVEACQTFEMV